MADTMIERSLDHTDHTESPDIMTETRSGLDVPPLVFEEYFLGPVRGHGILQDRFGGLRQEFTVDIVGRWDGDLFLLDEYFRFRDGKTSTRIWAVRPQGDGRYEATAPDILGTARGIAEDNRIRWTYTLALPVGGRSVALHFDDRMFLQEDGMLVNVSDARKFGLRLVRLCIAFRRL